MTLAQSLVEYCAPTLAGIKTGNIFSVRSDRIKVNNEIRKLNRILVCKGLRLIPIRNKGDSMLIYLYRPERLTHDLDDPGAEEILREKGYPCGNSNCCLVELVKHLKNDINFPHEIGLFLGYPPSDVKGFMEDPRKGVKCVGCWKVYSNECEAQKIFDKYKKCTAIYSKESERGKHLESLIVDTHSDVRVTI